MITGRLRSCVLVAGLGHASTHNLRPADRSGEDASPLPDLGEIIVRATSASRQLLTSCIDGASRCRRRPPTLHCDPGVDAEPALEGQGALFDEH